MTRQCNPYNCASCGHLPVGHEDGRGGLGPCHGRPASERRWWRRRACDCAGYVAQERCTSCGHPSSDHEDQGARRCLLGWSTRLEGCWCPGLDTKAASG